MRTVLRTEGSGAPSTGAQATVPSGRVGSRRASQTATGFAAEQIDGSSVVRGARLDWTATGHGPLVVFAHGMGIDRWALEQAGMLDWSAVPTAGRRLVRFDARGHGSSTGDPYDPRDPDQYTWTELARDLLVLVDDFDQGATGGRDSPIDAIGTSMGTGTLLHAAVLAPQRFRRLVLSAPPTAWETRAAQAGMYEQGAMLIETDGLEAMTAMLAHSPIPPPFADLPRYPPRLHGDVLPAVLRGAARSDLPAPRDLATIQIPALILAWAGDPGHPISTAQRLAEILPSAQLLIAETPEQLHTWAQSVVDFLDD
jgi:3-oxoadipate enol-lactonase